MRIASHTLQSLIPMVASSSAFFLQPRPALCFRPLGSPTSMVTLHPLILIPFLSHPALSKLSRAPDLCSHCAHILPQLDPSQGGFRRGADAMAFSLVHSLRLRHTFAAFIDIKKAFDSCWSKPLFSVSLISVSPSACGTYWHISCVAPCPRSVLVALSLHPGSTLALRKAELFLSSFSIYSSTVSLPLFVPPSHVVSLTASDSFCNVCQLYADDLVVPTASQADLHMALDAVHAWGVRCASPLVSAPPNPPLWSSVSTRPP